RPDSAGYGKEQLRGTAGAIPKHANQEFQSSGEHIHPPDTHVVLLFFTNGPRASLIWKPSEPFPRSTCAPREPAKDKSARRNAPTRRRSWPPGWSGSSSSQGVPDAG